MCKLSDDVPFDINHNEEIKYIEKIGKVASQINIDKDTYEKAIEAYFAFFAKQIKNYLEEGYFLITAYYSYLIPGLRITTPGAMKKVEPYKENLKQWYDNKFDKDKVFSLVPISLESHKLDQPPQKYCLILSKGDYSPHSGIEEIDISLCYENSKLWDAWNKIINNGTDDDFEEVNENICKNSNKLNIDKCLKNISKKTGKKNLKVDHISPFILTWFPFHEEWPYHYYIPSPMLSNTPVGGIVVGTKKPIDKKILLYLEDIALKVTVNINFLEHKEKVMQQSRRTAVTAIMSRNFSHNIGSHVLSTISEGYLLNTKDCHDTVMRENESCKYEGKVVKSESIPQTMDFFSYLQKRMDLIARMVGGQYTGGEPMYFVGDVLNGFLKQDLLLNHLVQDQRGFKKNKIQFKIYLPDNENGHIFTYKEKDETAQGENKSQVIKKWVCDDPVNDFLVSIPDGEIGCQAFYLFLESMMRNSAKYGFNKSAETFRITIKLEKSKDEKFYKVTIGDNLSLCNGKLVEEMRGKIKDDIIDNSGVLITKSFGIAEMREACRFLIEPFGNEYPAQEDKGERFPLWVDCPATQVLHYGQTQDYTCPLGNNCNHLAYTFNLMKPQMVGIVGKDDFSPNDKHKKYGINKLTLDELKLQKSAYQFVLIYINESNKENVFNCIKEHHLLPFRTMLVGENIQTQLPKRFITCTPNEISFGGEPDLLIISTYEAWIRNRWLPKDGNKAYCILAFERNDGRIFESYKKIDNLCIFKDKVKWSLYQTFKDNQSPANKAGCDIVKEENNNDYFLVYDNHSSFAHSLNLLDSERLLFLHQTGNENKKIFETLASPPYQNDFTFKYFLLGLLEAALTKVIIIDERVAESCIDQNNDYNIDHLDSLNKGLCYPVFYIENKGLNEEVKNKVEQIGSTDNKNKLWKLMLNSEILIKNDSGDKLTEADFIVVHYGIIETHEKLKKVDSLYSLAPSIVITSGRGAGTIKKDDSIISNLPFLEASILKDNTYPSISKYHLVRALMSIKGGA